MLCRAFVVAVYRRGDLTEVFIQHQHSHRICAGKREQLDVADWLPQIGESGVERARVLRQQAHIQAEQAARAEVVRRSSPFVTTRQGRTADGRQRRR